MMPERAHRRDRRSARRERQDNERPDEIDRFLDSVERRSVQSKDLYRWAYEIAYGTGKGGDPRSRTNQSRPTEALATAENRVAARRALSDIAGLIVAAAGQMEKVIGGLERMSAGPLYDNLPPEGMTEVLAGGEHVRVVKRDEIVAAAAAKDRRARRGEGYGES